MAVPILGCFYHVKGRLDSVYGTKLLIKMATLFAEKWTYFCEKYDTLRLLSYVYERKANLAQIWHSHVS